MTKKTTKEPQRYRFLRDNDGHDYLVPDERVREFHDLLDASGCDDHEAQEEFIIRFDEMRTGCHISNYSFTDPKDD